MSKQDTAFRIGSLGLAAMATCAALAGCKDKDWSKRARARVTGTAYNVDFSIEIPEGLARHGDQNLWEADDDAAPRFEVSARSAGPNFQCPNTFRTTTRNLDHSLVISCASPSGNINETFVLTYDPAVSDGAEVQCRGWAMLEGGKALPASTLPMLEEVCLSLELKPPT